MNGKHTGKMLPAGSPDPDFGTSGQVHYHSRGSGGSSLMPDGTFLTIGVEYAKIAVLVRRLSDGSLDPNFPYLGQGGIAKTPLGFTDDFRSRTRNVLPDGKVLIGGVVYRSETPLYICYVRLTPQGQLDGSFGVGGRAAIDDLPGRFRDLHSAGLQSDGKIVVLASITWSDPNKNGKLLFRLHVDGTLDKGFGTNGFAYDFPRNGLYGLQILPDGKILLNGGSNEGGMISRCEPDGSVDRSFGYDGHFYLPMTSGYDEISNATVQSNGKILVVGQTGDFTAVAFIARLDAKASGLDSGFNKGQPLLLPWREDRVSTHERSALQLPDGKILSVGFTFGVPSLGMLRRFLPDGSPDTDFGQDGVVEIAPEGNYSVLLSGLRIQEDGKYVVTGQTSNSSGNHISIFRFLP
ncbi:hypothetical protein [Luteibacter yeojuensis]|uniref:Delta-60 repeat protein n=1 Tax=Luteibacter yeojuensis TaxID=345309 RepID=A0A7X5QRA0_9GAMM|nr:hypothetical protein [Luteibacter yeojuensis]NID13957.1 hypothetical protein [Luteibacter yeojuensis]